MIYTGSVNTGSFEILSGSVVPCCRKNRLLACARGIGNDTDAAYGTCRVNGVGDRSLHRVGVLNIGVTVVPNFVCGIVNIIGSAVKMPGKGRPVPMNLIFICGYTVFRFGFR